MRPKPHKRGAETTALFLLALLVATAGTAQEAMRPPLAPTPPGRAAPDAQTAPEPAVAESAPFAEADSWFLEDEDEPDDPAQRDPLEPFNRRVFDANERVYDWLLDPISRAYAFAVPDPARLAIRRLFANLREPVVFVNDLLQLAPRQAGSSGARFLINTTVGVAGLFDPAAAWGLHAHETDFGQTLAVYRVGGGPYLVIPVLGPSSMRDAVGVVVDGLLRPDTWLLPAGPSIVISAGSGFATYDVERERIDALRATSVDFYAALRGAYLMDRDAALEARLEALGRQNGSP